MFWSHLFIPGMMRSLTFLGHTRVVAQRSSSSFSCKKSLVQSRYLCVLSPISRWNFQGEYPSQWGNFSQTRMRVNSSYRLGWDCLGEVYVFENGREDVVGVFDNFSCNPSQQGFILLLHLLDPNTPLGVGFGYSFPFLEIEYLFLQLFLYHRKSPWVVLILVIMDLGMENTAI